VDQRLLPDGSKTSQQITLILGADMLARLDEMAQQTDQTRSGLIKRASCACYGRAINIHVAGQSNDDLAIDLAARPSRFMSPTKLPRPVAVCLSCHMATCATILINQPHRCNEGQWGTWRIALAPRNWDKCRLCK
jgi:hypothetical protein